MTLPPNASVPPITSAPAGARGHHDVNEVGEEAVTSWCPLPDHGWMCDDAGVDYETYRAYTSRLLASLEARSDIVGLVALGSMAEQGEVPDAFSDHDFFVIAGPHAAEAYRERSDWLPDHARIALRFRETAHGVKVVYAGGHLVEFAVFTPDEIALARVNRYRVLLDRGDVAARMSAVAHETRARLEREAPSDEWLVGQLLTEVLVASVRAARGEHTSAAQRRQAATQHLLRLVARHVPTPSGARLDPLDPTRRVELAYPSLAARLYEAEREGGAGAVRALLDLADRELAPRIPGFPHAALEAIRAACGATSTV